MVSFLFDSTKLESGARVGVTQLRLLFTLFCDFSVGIKSGNTEAVLILH
jgi:hypothetical protein